MKRDMSVQVRARRLQLAIVIAALRYRRVLRHCSPLAHCSLCDGKAEYDDDDDNDDDDADDHNDKNHVSDGGVCDDDDDDDADNDDCGCDICLLLNVPETCQCTSGTAVDVTTVMVIIINNDEEGQDDAIIIQPT